MLRLHRRQTPDESLQHLFYPLAPLYTTDEQETVLPLGGRNTRFFFRRHDTVVNHPRTFVSFQAVVSRQVAGDTYRIGLLQCSQMGFVRWIEPEVVRVVSILAYVPHMRQMQAPGCYISYSHYPHIRMNQIRLEQPGYCTYLSRCTMVESNPPNQAWKEQYPVRDEGLRRPGQRGQREDLPAAPRPRRARTRRRGIGRR